MNEETVDDLKTEIIKDGWENRRTIAWISFLVCLFYPMFITLIWHYDEKLAALLLELATPVFALSAANITWYFTMSTWEDIKK